MNKQEIIDILSDDTKNEWLFKKADETRQKYVGDEVHLRALIEFSNICKRQCLYCGLRSPNKDIERYRLSKDEILSSVVFGSIDYGVDEKIRFDIVGNGIVLFDGVTQNKITLGSVEVKG